MRPYSIRKEDSKYIQPSISNATGNQPSPLALLAATCSKIGDTFLEDTTIFTQKNLSLEKDRNDITTLKSCVEIRPNVFGCVERTDNILQNTGQPLYSPNTQVSPCMKIKHEESFDYNQNCEGLHICPNVIAETRMLDSQARASFGKTSHREIQSTCDHSQGLSSDNSFNISNSSCEHSGVSSQGILPENSCVFQNTCTPTTSSNYPLEHLNLQTCTLSHMPPINPIVHYSGVESFQQRQKQYHSNWQSQPTFQRNPSISTSNEKSCLLSDNYNNLNSCEQQQSYSNGSYERHYRNTLSHLNSPSQTYDRHHSPMSQTQEQYHHTEMNTNCNTHGYHYENYMDVKQESFNLQQMPLRQNPSACMGNSYQADQTHILHHQQQALQSHMNIPPVHNHPVGMPSSYCSLCNPQGNNTYLPELVATTSSMTNAELQNQNLAEYQYQQQQMMFARDNRRPRRIACTCPNCRDGENKTVTTKDGKQRKLHVCHIPGCGKIYGKTSHLRAHLRWHAGERPFACNWLFCNKRFTRSDELQRHRRTHTGDKRFECSVCLKKFMRSDHLSKHMKTHQSHKQTKEKTENRKSPEIKESRETIVDSNNKMKI